MISFIPFVSCVSVLWGPFHLPVFLHIFIQLTNLEFSKYFLHVCHLYFYSCSLNPSYFLFYDIRYTFCHLRIGSVGPISSPSISSYLHPIKTSRILKLFFMFIISISCSLVSLLLQSKLKQLLTLPFLGWAITFLTLVNFLEKGRFPKQTIGFLEERREPKLLEGVRKMSPFWKSGRG